MTAIARGGTARIRFGWTKLASVIAFSMLLVLGATAAWAFWSALSVSGGNVVSAAATVQAGATPVASGSKNVITVSWNATTLSNGAAVSGYSVKRYDASSLTPQTMLSACTGTVTTTSCVESAVPEGRWLYTVTPLFATNWRGPESAKSTVVVSDVTPPVNNLTISRSYGSAGLSGNTLYYRGIAAGSITVVNALADSGSGAASSATTALSPTTSGWSHAQSVVTTPSGGPYTSASFVWLANTTGSVTESVTGQDVAGNTATTTLSFINDSAAPTGTLTYTNGYQAGRSVSLSMTSTDSASGVQTAQLQRATAKLNGDTCDTFGSFSNIGPANLGASYSDSAVSNAYCYKYQDIVTDLAGNSVTITSSNVAKVDYAGAVKSATPGILSQWRLGDSSVTSATAADSVGINPGTYYNGVTEGVGGGLPNDANTAATFDGVDDYASVQRNISDDFSIEFWFRSNQGIGTSPNWYDGAGLVDAEVAGPTNDFGLSLRSDGRVVAGTGNPDQSIVSSGAGYNDGNWHYVAFTRIKASGSLRLFVDGASAGTATGGTNSLTAPANINFGRIQTGVHYYAGALDEVAVYTSALSQTNVTDHWQLGQPSGSDTSGPAGGSVAATGLGGTGSRYSTSTSLTLALAKGTDASGVASSGAQLLRATAPLTSPANADGTCGTFGAFVVVATDPATPKPDVVPDQSCIAYQYNTADNAGNYTTYSSSIIKVDSTIPTMTSVLTSNLSNSIYVNGLAFYYQPTAPSGNITVTATAVDSGSGIAAYSFPSLGTNWASTPGASGVTTYSWNTATTGAPAGSGTRSITATNNAGSASAPYNFTVTADTTAPSLGTLSYVDGTKVGTSANVTFTAGTDAGSGVGNGDLQSASAPLSGTTCGTFTVFSTIATNPVSPYNDTTQAAGRCYKYQYVVSDNVGNSSTTTSSSITRVVTGSRYEAESATLSGGAAIINNHSNYSGTGFVEGYTDNHKGTAKTVFTVTAPSAGSYYLSLGYANANGATKTLSLQVDSGAVQQISLPATTNWDTWATYAVNVSLASGSHTVSYSFGASDSGNVNLDYLDVYAANYAGTVNSTPGLLSYWRLDDSGTAAADQRNPPNNVGAYVNTPTHEVGATSDSNAATVFNGSNDVTIPRQISDDFSIEFWFKSSAAATGYNDPWWMGSGLVDADYPGTGNDFGVSLQSDGAVVAGTAAGTTTASLKSATGLNNGAWHHVVFTRSSASGVLNLYVDGVASAPVTSGAGSLTSQGTITVGGSSSGGHFFTGSIDEVAVYRSILTPATVSAHYSAR